jgi:beta-lactamase class A
MQRRAFLTLSGQAVAALTTSSLARLAYAGANTADRLDRALERFLAIPGDKSYLIDVEQAANHSWQRAHLPNRSLFVGSAVKTFILTRYLQDVERGRLSEDELLPINNDVRSLSSPIFLNLTGEASARTVLEAMISHSDNTATDACLLKTGVDRVRAFIASAGLTATRIPESTRIMMSYLAGAPPGVDKGWRGMKKIMRGELFGPPNPPINKHEAMVSTATELVSYYKQALRGAFFSKPETLVEFKRISAMADMIARVVPADTAAYAKGGSIDWQGFHAVCGPGQMVVRGVPVTFCFTLNWRGPQDDVTAVLRRYAATIAAALAAIDDRIGN